MCEGRLAASVLNGGMTVNQPYNLFRRKGQRALCCAVRQDKLVPTFLHGEAWDFGGTIFNDATQPTGFQAKAANEATTINGYYLFHAHHEDGGPVREETLRSLAA